MGTFLKHLMHTFSADTQGQPGLHEHPVSINCQYHLFPIFVFQIFTELSTKLMLQCNNTFCYQNGAHKKLSLVIPSWPHSEHEKLTKTNASKIWTVEPHHFFLGRLSILNLVLLLL